MEYSLQVQLAHEVFEHIDAGTTCLADDVATNPIVSYTNPDRLVREMRILFRRYPLIALLLRHESLPSALSRQF